MDDSRDKSMLMKKSKTTDTATPQIWDDGITRNKTGNRINKYGM